MERNGNFDFRQIERLQRQIRYIQNERDQFFRDCAMELAARLLRKVKQRTPVKSGNLRRKWDIGQIIKNGEVYEIEIINPTEYAAYVEYGHRTPDHRGWIQGKFMMTISEQEIQALAPSLLERRLEQYLRRGMGEQ